MLRLDHKLDHYLPASDTISLDFAGRQRNRFRARLDSGREAGVFLRPGQTLRDGDLLGARDGTVVRVRAAVEPVSQVRCENPELLARLCYHLGNRHVPLEIEGSAIRYPRQPSLDEFVARLELAVEAVDAVFEPEAAAHGGHRHHDH